MAFSVLADENVERQAARYLHKRGHDVEMVVDVLQPGETDDEIRKYAESNQRLVLTSDADFLATDLPTLFVPDDKLDAFTLAEIVDTIDEQITREELPRNVYVTTDWL